jgi:adenylate kinase
MSGSGRRWYLSRIEDLASKEGKNLLVVHVGEQMYEKSKELGYPIPDGTILDTSERQLDYLRGLVFDDILTLKEKNGNIVIDTHACFRWHKHLTKAFDYYYLSKLNPDLYITITDTIYSIYGRLQKNHWKNRNNLTELLAWRDEETFVTKTFAKIQKKPHFLVARDEPPQTLYNIIFNSKMKKVYLSYPISAAETRNMKKVQEFRDHLRTFLVVFDPMSIKDVDWLTLALTKRKRGDKFYSIPFTNNGDSKEEVKVSLDELEKTSAYFKDQTIARDYELINQSDFVAVYYYNPNLPSPGVEREIRYAKDSGKHVFLYLPAKAMSPFRELDIAQHFKKAEDLVEFLRKTTT